MSRVSHALAIMALATLLVGCQTTQPTARAMSIDDVVALIETGASSVTLGNAARVNGLAFPLTVENIVLLRERGIGNPHIDALLLAERDLAIEDAERAAASRPNISLGFGFGYHGGHRHRYYW